MPIEKQLQELIDIGEKQLELLGKILAKDPALTYPEQRKADEKAVAGNRPRGPQALKPAVTKVPEPTPEPDFLEDEPEAEPAKAVTLDEVKTALVAYRGAQVAKLGDVEGKAVAMKLLADHGGGAKLLPGTKASTLPDGSQSPDALKPEFFAAVLAATKK